MNKNYLPTILLILSSHSLAATGPEHCAEMTNERARLNCYDALFQKSVDAMALPAEQTESKAEKGTNSHQTMAPTTIRVLKVHRNPPSKTLYVLANGETWVQANHQPNTLSPGAMVELRPGFMGSTFLASGSGISVRVKKLT
ncbi:MAG: hypothetical protein ACPGXJ_00840 [Pseudomonadales bacterium]